MRTSEDLRRLLHRLDGRGYRAYKDIEGTYAYADFALAIDHVQGDPFAEPSRFRIILPQRVAGFPAGTFSNKRREIALRDFLTRCFDRGLRGRGDFVRGSGKSGVMFIDAPGQEILERSSAFVNLENVEVRFKVGLPARGRTIMGKGACRMIVDELPGIVKGSLHYKSLNAGELARHIEVSEDQDAMRAALREKGLLAFVADGSTLPRRSGIDDRPLREGHVVAFESPPSLKVTLEGPNGGPVTGMGIPEGVTLVVGGGFHGKSTLLNALELGVYNHIPDDGRERVVTRADAVKIRAEDGRSVVNVDISPFIGDLPYGRSTREFSTENASGSTSQAANIVEALEAGSKLLLIDEDTSATNFMIRDARMQRLVAGDKEPIRPLVDLARPMYEALGVSMIIVMGGSGDYLDIADTVIMMDSYHSRDVTVDARGVARDLPSRREPASAGRPWPATGRLFDPSTLDAVRGARGREKVAAKGLRHILFGRRNIDLSAVEQVVDESQTRAIGDALIYLRENHMKGGALSSLLDAFEQALDRHGIDALMRTRLGDRARPRRYEVAAALNRLRGIRVRK